jgi:multidrug resistance protein, MATE family
VLKNWNAPCGYKAVLKVSLPLVASMVSTTLMLFTDRLFLGWYSTEALAASTPAGLTAFTLMSFFLGVAAYTTTFVAQYTGSGAHRRVGSSLWQGIYFSLLAGALLAGLSFFGEAIFGLAGHPPEIQVLEAVYFRILMLFAVFNVLHNTLASFYSGRGLTVPVMLISLIGAAVNIPLNYILINGYGGFPEMGIAGAAWATVTAHALIMLLYMALIFRPRNNSRFGVWKERAFNPAVFKRLLTYGIPAGISFFIDIFAFTFFLFIVGRIGTVELAASNIAFAINSLGFLPMIGFGIGTSALVGQAIGRGHPDDAVTVTRSALHLCAAYMLLMVALYLGLPEALFSIFQPQDGSAGEFDAVIALGRPVMTFIAVYSLFDMFAIIYCSTIKGAGDTRFVTRAVLVCSISLLVVPVYLAVEVFNRGLYTAWFFASAYVVVIGCTFFLRYRQGRWKTMRVIEHNPVVDVVEAESGIY